MKTVSMDCNHLGSRNVRTRSEGSTLCRFDIKRRPMQLDTSASLPALVALLGDGSVLPCSCPPSASCLSWLRLVSVPSDGKVIRAGIQSSGHWKLQPVDTHLRVEDLWLGRHWICPRSPSLPPRAMPSANGRHSRQGSQQRVASHGWLRRLSAKNGSPEAGANQSWGQDLREFFFL